MSGNVTSSMFMDDKIKQIVSRCLLGLALLLILAALLVFFVPAIATFLPAVVSFAIQFVGCVSFAMCLLSLVGCCVKELELFYAMANILCNCYMGLVSCLSKLDNSICCCLSRKNEIEILDLSYSINSYR